MPGPPAQHRGTVYGDDENAPKPGLGPPVRRRPQHAHRRASRSHPPQGLGTALRTPDRRNGVRVWGAVHVCSRWLLGVLQEVAHVSCSSGSSRAPDMREPTTLLTGVAESRVCSFSPSPGGSLARSPAPRRCRSCDWGLLPRLSHQHGVDAAVSVDRQLHRCTAISIPEPA